MAITRTPMVDDDGTGTTGTVINNAWKQQFYDQIDAAFAAAPVVGQWTAVPYSAANFTAIGGMTWTVAAGDQVTFAYALINKVAILSLALVGTTIGGTVGSTLYVTLPGALLPTQNGYAWARVLNGGTSQSGLMYVVSGTARVEILLLAGGNWVAGTDNTLIQGSLIFAV